jgi:hypothetical protein
MLSTFRRGSLASLTLLTVACAPSIDVRTMATPDASFSALHSFRMLPTPARRDGRPSTGADDPMINNSIANRAIRDEIVRALQDRGYSLDERNADFVVAFYATTRDKLDVTQWDYGYPIRPGRPPYPVQTITQYTEGSVVIDMIKPGVGDLLWRGEGRIALSDDAAETVKQLAKTANAIVGKFPHATVRVVAQRP